VTMIELKEGGKGTEFKGKNYLQGGAILLAALGDRAHDAIMGIEPMTAIWIIVGMEALYMSWRQAAKIVEIVAKAKVEAAKHAHDVSR
jgi:hypothetical protein